MNARTRHIALACAALAITAVACADDKKAGNGVNDVRRACDIRAAWTRGTSDKCNDCQASAPVAACECPKFSEFGGLCEEQGKRAANEPDCLEVQKCRSKCSLTDCGCIDACFNGHTACKTATAASDGCVTETCDSTCK